MLKSLLSRRWQMIGALLGGMLLIGDTRAQDANRPPTYRQLAPGVVTVIPPELHEEETFSGPRPLVELLRSATDLQWEPKTLAASETLFAKAQGVIVRRSIWGLEFGFKPLRIIPANVRGTNQPVYYLVYYVKNTGGQLQPTKDEAGGGTFKVERSEGSLRFFPTFTLVSHDTDAAPIQDQVLPDVVERIRQREDAQRKFYHSVSISSVTIPVSTAAADQSVWGVATWVGVDPHSDFFSIFVRGLTNAYQWEDPDPGYQAGQPPMSGREFTYKTLQLNFWRPGDALEAREDEIRYGVPNENQVSAKKVGDNVLKIFGLQERVDYLWVYR